MILIREEPLVWRRTVLPRGTITTRSIALLCSVLSTVCLLAASSCDKPRAQDSVAPPPPATAPAPQVAIPPAAATQAAEAADNAPDGCIMMINQQPIQFPPARLRIKSDHDKVTAILYSDDPKDALNNNYTGNGFYFTLALDVSDAQFDHATWVHQSETSERTDSPYGIFLDGHRRQLQPLDVRIRLLPAASGGMKVEMAGTFLSVDPQDDLAATQVVPVAAWLLAEKR
jgi:hypothetical protein